MIIYEHPFNERIRTYLRLENLLQRLHILIAKGTVIDHHYALMTIFEIMDVGGRADLKMDLIQDLERQKQLFIGYRNNAAVKADLLESLLSQMEQMLHELKATRGKMGSALLENDWLMALRSRAAIPGGMCEFDLPAYCAWQHLPITNREVDIKAWAQQFTAIQLTLRLLLNILRESALPQKVLVQNGNFQQTLPGGKPFQLLRVKLDKSLNLTPEISGNRLLISIRVMRTNSLGESSAYLADVPLEITLCA